MQNHPIPNFQSTTKRTTPASTYKPVVKLTAHRGWYRVESQTAPGTFYETSANSCSCPARKPCKHQRFVRSLNVAFFVKKGAEAPVAVPMTAGAPSGIVLPVMTTPPVVADLDAQTDEAEQLLARKRRALADSDTQDDLYATLLRQVDQAERAVAALSYSAIRAA